MNITNQAATIHVGSITVLSASDDIHYSAREDERQVYQSSGRASREKKLGVGAQGCEAWAHNPEVVGCADERVDLVAETARSNNKIGLLDR